MWDKADIKNEIVKKFMEWHEVFNQIKSKDGSSMSELDHPDLVRIETEISTLYAVINCEWGHGWVEK